jgi:predicted Zn-dependent protease
MREQRPGEAIKLLYKALKEQPKWRQGWWRLGSLLYDAEDYPAARGALEQLGRLDPSSGAPWALQGLCEFEMMDYGLALQHLQKGDALGLPAALELNDTVNYHEALLFMLMRRFDPAQFLLDHLAQKAGEREELITAQGMAALRIPVLPESLAGTASADQLEIIRRVGQAQRAIAQQKPGEAVPIYRTLLERKPVLPNLQLSYAALLLQLGDRAAAQAELREELKGNPASVEARLRLCALLEDESPKEGLKLAAEAVKMEPKSFKTHFFLGKMLYKAEKFKESIRELEISRDLDPSSSMVRFALVRAYKAVGREADAGREATAFKTLRTAEDQFHNTGRLPASFFESNPAAGAGDSGKRPAAVH